MGRRMLPKLKPEIDFSEHLRELADLPVGYQVQDWFPTPQPLEVEVGSGKGLFLATQSKILPEHNFLGIEIAKKYARFAAYRLAKESCHNARMVRGDAQKLFELFLGDGSVHAVHIYFPDPWWKARHRKRRIVCDPFIKQVERVLEPGGILHFWTDVQEYFETGCETIRAASQLVGPNPVVLPDERGDNPYHTHFERRMLITDQPVYRCQFVKA
ncbi:MAG: tRNA (guanosine(46)-N7)-methyltransferase TrmB [Pirellulaceae bacterium]|nr:tRNA (guanosine(46)-N7)-methyltransferase TrmB [Pirellulaceae bacterium]